MTCGRKIGSFACCSVIQGNCLDVLRRLPDDAIDAFVTDPPYSSGGQFRSDRSADPRAKYVHKSVQISRPSFCGDNRDGRSWGYWCTLWISEALRATRESGYLLMFTDWRMLPTATDVIQAGGFVWRGLVAWDKGEGARAPHTGYFRHQCEYIVYGTKGVSRPAKHQRSMAGCVRATVRQADKFHLTGKPTELMRHLVEIVPPGGLIVDPFAGSGTTLVAARQRGRHFLGVEQSEDYCEEARRRIANADAEMASRLFPATEQMELGVPIPSEKRA